MLWYDILKLDKWSEKGPEPINKSGVCPKCKENVSVGDMCPIKLPSKSQLVRLKITASLPTCPMKVKDSSSRGPFTDRD